MPDWIANLAGRFLVFDGPDGSGKSTQFARFAARCRDHGVDVCEVREPGGTTIGEQIRIRRDVHKFLVRMGSLHEGPQFEQQMRYKLDEMSAFAEVYLPADSTR